jgi:hypothetical protein
MAYDEDLADRLREILGPEPGLTEKRMFGGLAFLLDGHMAVAAGSRGGLLLRVDPADHDRLTAEEHVEPFEMRGRPMKGWLDVGVGALTDDASLRAWVALGVDYVRTLPPKR